MAKVAFLGLGVMGYPMAGHLQSAGHDVTVYNRTAAKAETWVEQHGGAMAQTPREAADGAEFVLACVGNDDDLWSVCMGDDGAVYRSPGIDIKVAFAAVKTTGSWLQDFVHRRIFDMCQPFCCGILCTLLMS